MVNSFRADLFGTTKDKKMFIVECKSFKNSAEPIHGLLGSPARRGIILFLLRVGKANKLRIHEALKTGDINIAYKNTLWTLDRLEEDGLVILEHAQEQNHPVYVTLNKKRLTESLDMAEKELNTIRSLTH